MQHTATHTCNTLKHTATLCNTLQHTSIHYHSFQHTATHCNALWHTTTHCNKLQDTATRCNTLHLHHRTWYSVCVTWNPLQHTATHTATHTYSYGDMTESYVWHGLFKCATSRIVTHPAHLNNPYVTLPHVAHLNNTTHLNNPCHSRIPTLPNHMCDTDYSNVRHADALFKCATCTCCIFVNNTFE